ncbi:hypothetical protein [Streptomyces sp. NBC_01217]|uniref:hypothetical protein n=1 Tax=Streptomyces sp. NBC_01217 TaxID=2903779 RepID=UPI002E108918|nr:hypothetical protein OG507_15980 [Streptomyces sp. NBC_01217]
MFRSSLSRHSAGAVRTAAVTGLAVVMLALSAGAATASGPATPGSASQHGGGPEHAAQTICTRLEAVVDRLPDVAAPVEVCKLVNGWD